MNTLYENIKNRRKELGMTQTDLAEKMGYKDKSMISKIEKGKVDLSQSKIMEFAEVLGVEPGDLMGWEEVEDKHEVRLSFYYDAMCRPELQKLIEAAYNSSEENIELVTNMLKKMK